MLVEPAHLEAAIFAHFARLSVQRPGDQLGEGGLARAVDAEQTDAVVEIEPQVHVLEDRLAGLIAS